VAVPFISDVVPPRNISWSRLSMCATPNSLTNWICSTICHEIDCRAGNISRISPKCPGKSQRWSLMWFSSFIWILWRSSRTVFWSLSPFASVKNGEYREKAWLSPITKIGLLKCRSIRWFSTLIRVNCTLSIEWRVSRRNLIGLLNLDPNWDARFFLSASSMSIK